MIDRKRPHLKLVFLGALLVLGLWQLGAGLYIHAKARLGQFLIAQAWATSLTEHHPVKPWAWADTYPVGRLVIQELGIDHYVLAGASGRTLAFGPGHHDGTVLPGESGHSVIAGHRDTHFAFLKNLQIGQVIEWQNQKGHWQRFQVSDTFTLNVNTSRLVVDSEAPGLVLITCYPFHSLVPGPLRYVVLAKRSRASKPVSS